jgi:hypothetical protein
MVRRELDPEISAMNDVLDTLTNLDNGQRKRIVDWISARFKLKGAGTLQVPGEGQTAAAPEIAPPVELMPEIKRTRKPRAKRTDEKDITDYETVLDLFSEANVKKVSSKILLMGAYLQEKLKFEEISSFDINSRLKRIKHGVTNISSSINGLLKKTPKVFEVIEKPGEEKVTRRKFRVTEEGLKQARSFLK